MYRSGFKSCMFTRSGITWSWNWSIQAVSLLTKNSFQSQTLQFKKSVKTSVCASQRQLCLIDYSPAAGGRTDGWTGLMALGQAHRSTTWVVPVTSTTYCSSSSTLLAQLTVRTTSLINSTINLFSKLQLHIPLLF